LHFCYIAAVFLNDPNLLKNSDFVAELFSLLSVYLCSVCGFYHFTFFFFYLFLYFFFCRKYKVLGENILFQVMDCQPEEAEKFSST